MYPKNDYRYILEERSPQRSLQHSFKYIQKIKEGDKWRYFYTQEEYKAFTEGLNNKKNQLVDRGKQLAKKADKKAGQLLNPARTSSRKVIRDKKEEFQEVRNAVNTVKNDPDLQKYLKNQANNLKTYAKDETRNQANAAKAKAVNNAVYAKNQVSNQVKTGIAKTKNAVNRTEHTVKDVGRSDIVKKTHKAEDNAKYNLTNKAIDGKSKVNSSTNKAKRDANEKVINTMRDANTVKNKLAFEARTKKHDLEYYIARNRR